MRLVNREFEIKVSAKYFKDVVVPFRSELYSDLSCQDRPSPSAALLSTGLRVFRSFGRHISRFALSLELNELDLAHPPVKPIQKLVPTYWGVYRWPHSSYHRYAALEDLEQTADETDAMKIALSFLTQVTDLGLCCDAGLGYLSGPDRRADQPYQPHLVFSNRLYRDDRRPATPQRQLSPALDDERLSGEDKQPSPQLSMLERMAKDAGYTKDQVPAAIKCLLSTEGTSLGGIDFDERADPPNGADTPDPGAEQRSPGLSRFLDGTWPTGDIVRRVDSELRLSSTPLQPRNLTRAQMEMLLELEWAHRALIQSYVIAIIDTASAKGGITPNPFQALTTLTIAKIPSSHIAIFHREELWQSLKNLSRVSLGVVADWRKMQKIAPMCIEDVPVSPADAVPKVFKLLKDFVAKCRNIKFLHFEWIGGGEFACGVTQRNQHVLPAPFADDIQFIVSPDAARTEKKLLLLPYIEQLSLKNCYCTPHVFLQTVRQMALHHLREIELESFSLTGRPTTAQQLPLAQQQGAGPNAPPVPPAAPNAANFMFGPPPVGGLGALGAPLPPQAGALGGLGGPAGLTNVHLAGLGGPLGFGAQQMFADGNQNADTTADMLRLELPRLLEWAGIIEHFSPCVKISTLVKEKRDNHPTDGEESDGEYGDQDGPLWPVKHESNYADNAADFIPAIINLCDNEQLYKLKRLSFKSCGYVSVDAPFINTAALNASRLNMAFGVSRRGSNDFLEARRKELAPYMQTCAGHRLGIVRQEMRSQEVYTLTTAFGMEMGWLKGLYDHDTIRAARLDGMHFPGIARFSGVLEGGD
jgi:hypothetical protein